MLFIFSCLPVQGKSESSFVYIIRHNDNESNIFIEKVTYDDLEVYNKGILN